MGLCAGVCAGNRKGHDDREPQLNRALVFIKPHAQKAATQDLVRDRLSEAGLSIDGEGEVPASEIESKQLVDWHYYAIASKATLLTPDKLNVPASKFQDKFKEKWPDVLKSGRAANALQACEAFGLTAEELDEQWREVEKKGDYVKLGGGFYCGRMEGKGKKLYVFNPFFMSMRAKFTAPDASIYYYSVSWSASELSWARFRGEVLGATDPAQAAEGSLRRTILQQWEALGLAAEPNKSDNGVHGSASPFEGLAETMNWLERPASEDAYGRALIARGLDEATLEEWARDAQVKVAWDTTGSVFDALENLDADPCMEKLLDFLAINRLRNQALLLVKPHAQTAETRLLVRKMLDAAGIDVVREGEIGGDEISEKNLIDEHYFGVAAAGALRKPAELARGSISAEAFQSKFKESWSGALAAGEVLNGKEALDASGIDSPERLEELWRESERRHEVVKLGEGCFCGKLEAGGKKVYVLNGFYMLLRSQFTAPEASVYYYCLSWAPEALPWTRFRTNVIGASNPKEALPGSLRRLILDQWQDLGLAAEPCTSSNGVHASASPLEAMAQRVNWLESSPGDDPFGRLLKQRNLDEEHVLEPWLKNPQVALDGKAPAPLFSAVEDLDVVPCMERLLRVAAASAADGASAAAAAAAGGGAAGALVGGSAAGFRPAPEKVPPAAAAAAAAAASPQKQQPQSQALFGSSAPSGDDRKAQRQTDPDLLNQLGDQFSTLLTEAEGGRKAPPTAPRPPGGAPAAAEPGAEAVEPGPGGSPGAAGAAGAAGGGGTTEKEKEAAAAKIQALHRGNATRQRLDGEKAKTGEGSGAKKEPAAVIQKEPSSAWEKTEEKEAAARKIQALHRGNATRQRLDGEKAKTGEGGGAKKEQAADVKKEQSSASEKKEAADVTPLQEREAAAAKIQALHRGNATRQRLDGEKAKTGEGGGAKKDQAADVKKDQSSVSERKEAVDVAPLQEREAAAAKIQALHRGNATRLRLDGEKAKSGEGGGAKKEPAADMKKEPSGASENREETAKNGESGAPEKAVAADSKTEETGKPETKEVESSIPKRDEDVAAVAAAAVETTHSGAAPTRGGEDGAKDDPPAAAAAVEKPDSAAAPKREGEDGAKDDPPAAAAAIEKPGSAAAPKREGEDGAKDDPPAAAAAVEMPDSAAAPKNEDEDRPKEAGKTKSVGLKDLSDAF